MWNNSAERGILAAACRDSFWQHTLNTWGVAYSDGAKRWFDPAVHKPLCDWFDGHVKEWEQWRAETVAGAEPRRKHLAIIVPREWWKTALFSQSGQVWLHIRNPELSTYLGSETLTQAEDWLEVIKKVISGQDPHSRFTWLYGNWKNDDLTWKRGEVMHAARSSVTRKEPSFGTWGVETGITGQHVDVLFFDDPISYERLGSDGLWLDKVNAHVSSLNYILTPDGMMVWAGTRYSSEDHFGRALQREGARSVMGMPCPDIIPTEDGKWDVYYMAGRDINTVTKESPKGIPTHPRVWPEARLVDDERRDPVKHAAQVMNNPAGGAMNVLNSAHLETMYVLPSEVPWNMLSISIHGDTAFKKPEKMNTGCDSVLEVWGHQRDGSGLVYYIEGYGDNTWQGKDYYTKLIWLVQKWRALDKQIIAFSDEEELFGKTGLAEMHIRSQFNEIKLVCPPLYFHNRGRNKKTMRILKAAEFWRDGKVRLVKGAPGLEKLIFQMTRIAQLRILDWADAGADVFAPEYYIPARGPASPRADKISYPYDNILKAPPRGYNDDDDEEYVPWLIQ